MEVIAKLGVGAKDYLLPDHHCRFSCWQCAGAGGAAEAEKLKKHYQPVHSQPGHRRHTRHAIRNLGALYLRPDKGMGARCFPLSVQSPHARSATNYFNYSSYKTMFLIILINS